MPYSPRVRKDLVKKLYQLKHSTTEKPPMTKLVNEAVEDYFIKKATKYGWTEKEISKSDLLDDGRYETEYTVYANVNLVWSQV